MLVLARRLNERIVIPCIRAAVQVVGIQSGQVRLGIEAPADVKVFREEVLPSDTVLASARSSGAEWHGRLADTAHELTMLRRQLRGKLSAAAAATLMRIDRDLAQLAREVCELPDDSPQQSGETAPPLSGRR
jgi:carbon storage regulator